MIVVCLLFLYILYNIFTSKLNNNNCYDVKVSNSFKGIAAVLIFFGHILQKSTSPVSSIFEIIIRNCGFIGVSIFLFNTGYGYSKKYNTENINIKFLYSHAVKIFLPYLIVLVLYNILTFSGEILLPYWWYVVAITGLTILYYICCNIKIFDKNFSLTFLSLIIIFILYKFNIDYYAISQLFTFSFGSILANKDIKISTKIKNYIIILILFSLTYVSYLYFGKMNFEYVLFFQIILGNIASCLIAFLVFLLGKKVILNNVINKYLGDVSYWFYLTQSISIVLLFKNYNSIIDNNIIIIISIVLNCILSGILYKLFNYRKFLVTYKK